MRFDSIHILCLVSVFCKCCYHGQYIVFYTPAMRGSRPAIRCNIQQKNGIRIEIIEGEQAVICLTLYPHIWDLYMCHYPTNIFLVCPSLTYIYLADYFI